MDNNNTSEHKLNSNKTDLAAAFAKAVLGIIPYGGGFLAEILGSIIPNQRVDRIAAFCTELDLKLQDLPSQKANSLLKNEEFIDFLEESFLQVSRAFTGERRNYIFNMIINGITDDNLEIIQSKHLLKLLNELNDIEIIWLRFYLDPIIHSDLDFREKHKTILTKRYAFVNCDEETLINASLQESYLEHLSRLELIEHKLDINKVTGLPIYSKTTGKAEIRRTLITSLGRLLLKQIGLTETLK